MDSLFDASNLSTIKTFLFYIDKLIISTPGIDIYDNKTIIHLFPLKHLKNRNRVWGVQRCSGAMLNVKDNTAAGALFNFAEGRWLTRKADKNLPP